jgi:FAD/FMN-containing dehydrogenase
MTAAELRLHPAYTALTPDERAAVETRLAALSAAGSGELDAEALAGLAGSVDGLDAEDLRAWLSFSAAKPWATLRPCTRPALAAAFAHALLEAAPDHAADPAYDEVERAAHGLGRALVIADDERASAKPLATETLAALVSRIERLERADRRLDEAAVDAALTTAGLTALRDALSAHRDTHRGVGGFFRRFGRWFETGVRDAVHGAKYLIEGRPEHEGEFDDGVWRSWHREIEVRPANYRRPRTEAELASLVAGARQVRVVGGGHGFNRSPECDDLLVSLDEMNALVHLDREHMTARVQAGVRLRDLNRLLWNEGFGLALLGSTDAQSIGGLIASDLHGTGRDHGFLSDQLHGVRVMAADGTVREARPGDGLFEAVMGALGTCGIVTEAEIGLVPAYHVSKTTAMVDRAAAEAELDATLAAHEHVSFYYVGGAETCVSVRRHTWDTTTEPLTPHWPTYKAVAEIQDFAISAFVPSVAELLAEIQDDAVLSDALAPDRNLVMPCSDAYGRKLFYLHDEIEYGVPFEVWRPCVDQVMRLLADRNFFSIVEVRFTPDMSRSLLGGGAGRRTAWIELATPLGQSRDAIYAEFEEIMRRFDGQPHLGKRTSIDAAELARLHGERFERFQRVRAAQDPGGKFLNEFTRRVFGG